jgi:low affinity Fe/Cu permease
MLLILAWFVIGGYFLHFNHQWFFILEAFAISITLVMTFVIEHTQKADTKALQEKLDELLKKHPKADKKKVGIERRYKGEK